MESKDTTFDVINKKLLKIELLIYSVLLIFIISFYFILPINNSYNPTTFFYKWYWIFATSLLVIVGGWFVFSYIRTKKQKKSLLGRLASNCVNYGFLLRQLVSRDFKSKYKRSFLGVLWSFLNPLLMMGVQYLIFSTIFGNENIPIYPVYLLIGVIVFQFFSESTSTGLVSISGNASLLNKVRIPKEIFPLSKIISASINFALSLIPLAIVMIVCRVTPSVAVLLFLVDYLFLFIFLYGLLLFLSALMVYFRDVQFLWGIINMVWMYGTPIFYDLNFIKIEWVRNLMKFNPLYHYINFARICLRDGACPDIMCFVYILGFAVIMLFLGAIVFKRKEDDFVLHL